MSIEIITSSETEINQALVRCNPSLPELIADILNHAHEKELMNQIISSQLDADRMDYLLRDAYETGT